MINLQRPRAARVIATGTTEQLAALMNATEFTGPTGPNMSDRDVVRLMVERALYRRHADRAETMTTGQILDELEPIADLQLTGPEATRVHVHALMNELYGRHGETRTAEDQWYEESQQDEAVYLRGPAGHTVRALRALDTP